MPRQVRIVAFPRSIQLPEGLGEAIPMLKFVVVREGDDGIVILGYTKSHYVLALWYALASDVTAVARHLGTPPFVCHTAEMRALYPRIVGAGRIAVGYEDRRRRVPAADSISEWESSTLDVKTPEDLREELTRVLLAHIDAAIAADNVANPPLPQREWPTDF